MESIISGTKSDSHYLRATYETGVVQSDKVSKLNVESFPFFDPLDSYTLEEAKKNMIAYRVNHVFLLTRGQKENEYTLTLYDNNTISDFYLKLNGQEFVFTDGEASPAHLDLLIAFIKGMIPFSFLYELKNENLFLPLIDEKSKDNHLDEMKKISKGIPENLLRPYVLFLYSQEGQLNLLYAYQKEGKWDSIKCSLDETDFKNFQLVLNKEGHLRCFLKGKDPSALEESVTLEPTLKSFNKNLFNQATFNKATPLPDFMGKCMRLKPFLNDIFSSTPSDSKKEFMRDIYNK